MPQTGSLFGPELAIALDSSQDYQPGDVIVGRITRSAHIVSPRGSVTVKLFGRTKSKITVRRRHRNANNTTTTTTSHYRGRFSLFEVVSGPLFDGPIHIPPEGQPAQWPFRLNIPVKPWQAVAADEGSGGSFLPLDPGAVSGQGLPFTFYCEHNENSHCTHECFVEYVIEATLHQEHGSKMVTTTAAIPITIRPAPSPRVTNFDLRLCSLPGSLRSQRLLPGMEDSELSFKEKTAKFFHSSKVPKLIYRVEVECPSVLQLGNPFPFCVRVVPDQAASSESIAKVEHVVHLTGAHFKIKAQTEVLATGTWGQHEAQGVRRHEFDLAWRESMMLPSGGDVQPLDLGTQMGIRFYPGEVTYNGGSVRFETPIYPSFTTYNIRHSHGIKWKLTISLAKESFEFESEQPVLILGPEM